MKREYNVIVAGAGMVGLTAAALLADSAAAERLNIQVVDSGKRPCFDVHHDVRLRVSAISAGSARIFESLDIWQRVLATRACPFRDMRVWEASRRLQDPETLQFDAAEFGVPELGHIVENLLLQSALLERLEGRGVPILFDTAVKALRFESNGVILESGSGSLPRADLLIGADGADSFVRQQASIAVSAWRYPQHAFVTHVEPELIHRYTAWQRFLADGPLALLPLQDGRVSVVWSTTPAATAEATAADDSSLGLLLAKASDHVLGALTVAGPRASFPLHAQHAAHYVSRNLALIGDAAHSIHPLAGQGANLGIADAAVLAAIIEEAVSAGDHPGDVPVLRRYERARRGSNQLMLHFVDVLNRVFSSSSPSLAALRGTGMRVFNASGPLRNLAVRTALGVNGGR